MTKPEWNYLRIRNKPNLGLCLLFIWVLVSTSCNHHFFNPQKGEFYLPEEFGLTHREVQISTSDGEILQAWFIPTPSESPKGTILYLHGNSINMTNYLYYIAFLAQEGYQLLMFNYRGFGDSTGEPTPKGVILDAQAALDFLRNMEDVDPQKLVVYGQSLGGAVVISLVGKVDKKGILAVIAEAPFSSFQQVAQEKIDDMAVLGWFSGTASSLFIDDQDSPIRFVNHISPIPLLIVHGTADRVVPYHHGEDLFKAAGEPKFFWTIQEGRHIQMLSKYRSIYRPKILEFLEEVLGGEK